MSTVLGRRLGGELLRLRDASGKTQQQAAEAISATNSKIVKMERGWVPMRDPDIKALHEFYGATGPEVLGHLLELARLDRDRRKARGWWRQTPPEGTMAEYVAMEDAAMLVRNWQVSLIPGLLQTLEYTRALAVGEGDWDDPDEIDRYAEVKRRRQQRLLSDNPLQFYGIVWEAALRQEVGGRNVMRAQLERMLELAELPNVRLQVLPFRAGSHPSMAGPFSIISFAEDGALDVVQSDTVTDMVWVEDAATSTTYRAHFEHTARLSLAPRDSIALIEDLRKEM
ncbi:helix-turn-helix domain-containing protein [Streptomyces kunmingensis]|uniref:Helix-turn-helix domain-containing protein n=1 Tax=Streptomyces kunmingensis TaxID=68225 RepID=A0ABU6CDY9_9ACTN|nr:helix-turn-helix transcriptional regulator [Streptomyces kunmingensis]MEB3962406.1 helix-turn-helix domain-containing protein [Streptomyces kunmingensis]